MKILFINNLGGGFAGHVDISEGTTVERLFQERMIGEHPENYLVRVNRQIVVATQLLVEGDRVTFTPIKIEGAA